MVINVGWLKSGLLDEVKADIAAVREVCAAIPLKVILETCLLSDAQIVQVCEMCRELDVVYGSTTYCNFTLVKYSPLASSVRVIYVAFCCYTAPDIQPFFD